MERNLSLRKKAANAMERLDVLESQVEDVQKTIQQLAMAMNNALNQSSQQVAELRETLDAVVGLVGLGAVQSSLEESRLARMIAAAEETKANIAKALEEGKMVKTDKISGKSLIIGREFRADGTEIPPGFAAIQLVQVKDDYRIKLLDQAPGFTMATEAGGKFEVMDVYEPVDKPAVAAAPVEAAKEETSVVDATSPAPDTAPAGV